MALIEKDVKTIEELKTVIGHGGKAAVLYDVNTGEPYGLDVEVLIAMDASIGNKVEKVTGKSLIADTEIARLSGVTNQTLGGLGGEAAVNKQDSLAVDGHGIKFPTVDAVNLGLATKPAKTTQVVAGAGLTGGGTLEADRTLNVVSANDGITVNADNIQLNVVDGLASTSATQPLSAKQGKALNDGKVDKVAGKSLILDTEIARLSGITNQTKQTLGLENVDNTSDAAKPISTATQTALNGKVNTTDIEQVRSQATNKVASSKLLDDELTALENAVYANNQTWVGVVIDPILSSSEPAPKSTVVAYRATELMRTGNLYYHKFGNSRIFNAFQPAIVDRATCKVAWYLNKNNPALRADGTISTPDWTTQNIAVVVPNLYRRIKVLDEGTGKYEVAYDIAPFDGAQLWHEESAHSPGFASMDRTLTQLVSVVTDDVRFRGGANESTKDLLPSTQLGRPATNISRINFENYAAAAGWETGNIADRTMWHELTALYFANTNIQLDYTTTLTAEGYPQGGLGAGVTNWNSSRWNFRNGYYPIHKVGEGFMTLGCNTGVKSMTDEKYYVGAISSVSAGNLVATGQFSAGAGWSASYIGYTVQNLQTLAEATITGKTDDNTLTLSADIFTTAGQWYWIKGVTYSYQIPVFFGLEHLYGEIWDWVSGVNIEVSATVENGGTGESKAYVCTDFSKRAATITADYKYIGLTPRADNYIKELYRDFAIAKVNTGAGSATFMSDYGYYGNLPASGSVVRGLLFGANALHGVNAGVRTLNASYVPTYTYTIISARLRAKIEK